MRAIDFESCLEYIELVKQIVGEDWLSKQVQKIRSHKPPEKLERMSYILPTQVSHPLAWLIYQADKHAESSSTATQEMLRLSYLGKNLSVLKDVDAKGLDRKIGDLTSASKRQFDSAAHEIETAARYTEKGYPVEFVEESTDEGVRTPDILIGFRDGIEVECKAKERRTTRDIRNAERWYLIMRKASALMEYVGLNYALYVRTQADPTPGDLDFISKQLRTHMRARSSGRFEFADRGITVLLQVLLPKDKVVELETGGVEGFLTEECDHVVVVQEARRHEDGKVFAKNLRIFGFKSEMLPDRIAGVVNSLKAAKKQLSGGLPALVHINADIAGPQMVDRDFQRLDSVVTNVLRNNSTISGAVITAEFFTDSIHGPVYGHSAYAIRNEAPRHPLPSEFRTVGETNP